MWDFSSSPYKPEQMNGENFNWIDINCFEIGFEHSPVDWFAWSPFIRWDCSDDELEEVGSWFDYRTDCLGFRFIVSYKDSYTRIDRSKYDSDWSFGFFIYLRAIGADASNLFTN
jgi:lipopolysaccharide assembly outer membrane protein LptD (OstA)